MTEQVHPGGGIHPAAVDLEVPLPGDPFDVDLSASLLREASGYRRKDLFVIAEMARHYLLAGVHDVALALFEGLASIAPSEAHFALGLGLTYDRMGYCDDAHEWYAWAAELDPRDGRPAVNRAELHMQAGQVERARALLLRGQRKAADCGDDALEQKAAATLEHLEQRQARPMPRGLISL